ncbi:C-type lectin domain family 5 member A [Ctenodactylus gundi]
MNWHMIISVLIVVILKSVGVTLFLLYFPQIFGKRNDGFIPTESYGTVSQIFGSSTESFVPTRSYGTACPRDWNFYQGKCFLFSIFESLWNEGKNDCEKRGSNLAIVDTPGKRKYLQDIADAEKYFIGLMYKSAEKKWRWIDNSEFKGNVTNEKPNFDCVTIGLTTTFDAAPCDIRNRWICEKNAQ